MIKILNYVLITSCVVLITNFTYANVKPIPKAFHGKWVGHVDKKLNHKDVALACRGQGSWGTWVITLNSKSIKFSYPAGGVGQSTFLQYHKYSSSSIQGIIKTKSWIEGDHAVENEKINFSLKQGKLHYTRYMDGDIFLDILTKCK